jgi:hypothetical protein
MYGGLTGHGYDMYEEDDYEPESLGGLLLGGARRKKKTAMTHLRRLMAAESSAAKMESKAGHKNFAKRLADDYIWNAGVYKTKKTPAWMNSKYRSIYGKPAPKRKTASMSRSRASTAGKILNASTGRMVSRTGSIGKAILAHTYP